MSRKLEWLKNKDDSKIHASKNREFTVIEILFFPQFASKRSTVVWSDDVKDYYACEIALNCIPAELDGS